MVRGELARRSENPTPRRSLLFLVQLTDLQLADAQSPGRFEFFEYLRGRTGVHAYVPAQRPQELLGPWACDVMASTIASLRESPDTGAPLGLALCTGDNLDNAQLNELTWYLALLSGGAVDPASGGPSYEGVQMGGWPSDLSWHPDLGIDRYKSRWGFPDYPGLLDEATRSFVAGGVGIPWLSCFGNHDGLAFGEVVPTPAYRLHVLGTEKPTAIAHGLEPIGHEDEFFASPERYLTGPARTVTADPHRRIVSRRDFVEAHLRAGGRPAGHGFDEHNLAEGTAYGVYDAVENVRMILLDTTNMDGRSDGSLGVRQFRWLEERLGEVHAPGGSTGASSTSGRENRLVVLASHHGLTSMTNDRELANGPEEDQPRVTAGEVRALLHRHPNVVLWLNGHRHRNEVVLRESPEAPGSGFWEVSTVALADWPAQARLVELVANGDGTLSILCTMVDHLAGPDPRQAEGATRLAAIHRELAANVPAASFAVRLEGGRQDRNVELVLPSPFALS
jgi:metallophosphoesterase (TIGR03767 family)